MDLPQTININPVYQLRLSAEANKPSWLCAHVNAKVTDPENKRYNCLKCNPRGGNMRRISQLQIHNALQKISVNTDIN